MRPTITIMYALILLRVVCSCSKNSPKHTDAASTLKMYRTTSNDSSFKYYMFEKDANNRIITMRDSSRGFEFRANLTYGSNGKVEKVTLLNNGYNTGYFEFEYNSAGQLSKRKRRSGPSFIVNEEYQTYAYDAAGHLIADSGYSTINNSTYTFASVFKYKYTGENITEAEYYTVANGTPVLMDWLKYEYDSGKNPLKDLEYQYYIGEGGNSIYTIPIRSGNNVLKTYRADTNGSWSLLHLATNQYNPDNLLWKSTTTNVTLTLPAEATEYFYQ